MLEVVEKALLYLWSKVAFLHGAISHLLLVLASHGPALDAKTRGLQIATQGKVVYVLLVETVDGVAVKPVLGTTTVTGFASEPSLQDLEQLVSMNSADITRYIEQHPMVADTILTI